MRALWVESGRVSLREDLPYPETPPGDALIRIRLAGICGTDLGLLRGYLPFTGIPGHEFVGEVVEAGDPALLGRWVVGEINIACGACASCRGGRPSHCGQRRVVGIRGHSGVMAEYLALPEASLHLVPEAVPDEAAVFTEPLAAALEIQEQVRIRPSDRVLVVGAGRLGQLVAQTLVLTGCDLRVVAKHPRQRRLLADRGIRILPETEVPLRSFDLAVEATGSPAGFALARPAVRPRGTLVLKSTYPGEAGIDLSSLVVDEITLVGSRCGPFPAALRLLEQQAVDPVVLVDAEYPLSRGVEAFEHAGRAGALKVLLRP